MGVPAVRGYYKENCGKKAPPHTHTFTHALTHSPNVFTSGLGAQRLQRIWLWPGGHASNLARGVCLKFQFDRIVVCLTCEQFEIRQPYFLLRDICELRCNYRFGNVQN